MTGRTCYATGALVSFKSDVVYTFLLLVCDLRLRCVFLSYSVTLWVCARATLFRELNSIVLCSIAGAEDLFPAPTGRSGRHFQRQHIISVLITNRQQLVAEFASRD